MRLLIVLLVALFVAEPLHGQATSTAPAFPSLRGENLLGEEFDLPDDLPGDVHLVFVAFQQRQQPLVNTWLNVADAIEADFPGLRYVELPTIATPYRLMKPIIDNGMRSGIPSDAARARTITIFTNVQDFVEATGLPSTDDIAVILLDAQGRIRFIETGPRTEEKEEALRAAITELASGIPAWVPSVVSRHPARRCPRRARRSVGRSAAQWWWTARIGPPRSCLSSSSTRRSAARGRPESARAPLGRP